MDKILFIEEYAFLIAIFTDFNNSNIKILKYIDFEYFYRFLCIKYKNL